jgi:hypothetical protein
MQSMIMRKENDGRDFYFCESADWSSVVLADSESGAASEALKNANLFFQEDLQVSPCMRVKKIEEQFEDEDIMFRIEEVFADLGMHKCAKNISQILKDL